MTYNRCTAFPHVRQEIFSFHVNAQARVDAGFRNRPTGPFAPAPPCSHPASRYLRYSSPSRQKSLRPHPPLELYPAWKIGPLKLLFIIFAEG